MPGTSASGPKAPRPAMPGAGRPRKAALVLTRLAALISAVTAPAAQLQRPDLWSMQELRAAEYALTALAGLFEDEQIRRFEEAEDETPSAPPHCAAGDETRGDQS